MAADTRARRAPGPGALSGPGAALAFLRDPLAYFLALQARWGGIVRRRVGPLVFHSLFDPELVREALVEHHDCYTKRGVIDELLPLLGEGLLASEGPRWKARREGIAPLLGGRALAGLVPTMVLEAEALAERWERARRAERTVDASADAMCFAIAVIGRALFGLDLRRRAEEVSRAVETVATLALRRSSAPFKLPLRAPTPANRAYRAAIARLDALVYSALRGAPGAEPCLLPRLRALVDPLTGAALTERDLRDEAMTLLLAGHETTANTLAWALDALARDADLQRRLREERRALPAGAVPGLARTPLLDAVVSECLRLAPPAWLIMRRAARAHTLGGYAIPRGSFVSVPVHAIQRDPARWPEPERFRPERFLEVGERELPAFLPFGLGPRRCPGEAFARAETRALLSELLARFRLEPVGPPPAAQPLATLRPAEHVRLRLRRLREDA